MNGLKGTLAIASVGATLIVGGLQQVAQAQEQPIGPGTYLIGPVAPGTAVTPTGTYGTAQPGSQQSLTLDEYLISPFDLAYMAYRGQLQNAGIRGYGPFLTDYRQGNIEARDVVQAAVQTRRLQPQALNDSSYINAVEGHLQGLLNYGAF